MLPCRRMWGWIEATCSSFTVSSVHPVINRRGGRPRRPPPGPFNFLESGLEVAGAPRIGAARVRNLIIKRRRDRLALDGETAGFTLPSTSWARLLFLLNCRSRRRCGTFSSGSTSYAAAPIEKAGCAFPGSLKKTGTVGLC